MLLPVGAACAQLLSFPPDRSCAQVVAPALNPALKD